MDTHKTNRVYIAFNANMGAMLRGNKLYKTLKFKVFCITWCAKNRIASAMRKEKTATTTPEHVIDDVCLPKCVYFFRSFAARMHSRE